MTKAERVEEANKVTVYDLTKDLPAIDRQPYVGLNYQRNNHDG